MAYIVERNGSWFAVAYLGLDPLTGRDRRRWLPATDQDEAQRLAAGLPTVPRSPRATGGLTVGRYLRTRWLPAKQPTLRPTTWFRYRKMIELYVCPDLAPVPLASLAARHLDALYTRLLHEGRQNGTAGLAPKTVLNVHQIMRKALGDALRMQLVSRNVALAVDPPARNTSPEQRCWTASELQRFLATAASHRLHAALWLAATTGMRRGEILGLRWHDIDLDTGRLSVRRSVTCTGYQVHVTAVKTPTSRRSVDLDETTVEVLVAWRRRQATELADVAADDRPVFTAPTGKPLHPHSFSQAFDRLVRRAGLPRIRLHDMRHTHATLLLKASVPLKVVSERLGHSTPAFTMVVYQHVLPGMQRDAANTFATLLAGPTVAPERLCTRAARGHGRQPVDPPQTRKSPGRHAC